MSQEVSVLCRVLWRKPRYLSLLALHRRNQIHTRTIRVQQSIPGIAWEKLNAIGTLFAKQLKQLIEEPWRSYHRGPSVKCGAMEA
jgi:hypothetical protein